MAKFARCSFAKTTANCFNSFGHFHLISSVSRLQRPLIYDCIYFSFPSPVANISGENVLGALFIPKVPLETGVPPPQLFDVSYGPEWMSNRMLSRFNLVLAAGLENNALFYQGALVMM
jgi:hypothetical protein